MALNQTILIFGARIDTSKSGLDSHEDMEEFLEEREQLNYLETPEISKSFILYTIRRFSNCP